MEFWSTTPDLLQIRFCALRECEDGYQRVFSVIDKNMEVYLLVRLSDRIKSVSPRVGSCKPKLQRKKNLQEITRNYYFSFFTHDLRDVF